MSVFSNRRLGGKHRKVEVSATSRAAIVALSASTIASSSAIAAAQPATDTDTKATAQAADTTSEAPAAPAAGETSSAFKKTETRAAQPKQNSPLVLASSGFTPATDLGNHLATALVYNQQRVARDLQARAPMLSIPTIGVLTSPFGPRWGTFHSGVDLANVTNTPIMSVMDGTVIDAGPAQGYGQWVRVRHNDGSVSVYGHVESIYVAVGQIVRAGEVIAGMGNRGFSTGTHLHFEIHPDGVTPVDPVSWFIERGLNLG
nr:M23 family metallopeptidase [Corynebacterium lactis]